MTSLNLRFGDRSVRITCDSRRGVRRLRSALAEHISEGAGDAPLGFVLTAPQGFQRHHDLVDRSGFVLSRGRGLDAGLHALASHLTAFLEPDPGTVRVRARALVNGGRAVVCLFPLLYVPEIDERELGNVGWQLVDRLALDVEVATGTIVNREIPWVGLRQLSAGAVHAGPGARLVAMAVIDPRPAGSTPPTRADVVASLAGDALHGQPEEVLDATSRLVAAAEMRSTPPEQAAMVEILRELSAR